MILFPHMLIGAAIGVKIHNFSMVFILSVVGHLLADKIPHWEYGHKELKNFRFAKEWLIFLLKATADFGLGAGLVYYLTRLSPFWPFAVFGALISVLPDFLLFLHALFPKIKILSAWRNFHHRNHWPLKYRRWTTLAAFCETAVTLLTLFFISIAN